MCHETATKLPVQCSAVQVKMNMSSFRTRWIVVSRTSLYRNIRQCSPEIAMSTRGVVHLTASGTDYNLKKHSNRAGGFVDVVLRLRSTSLVKMIAAGVKHERRKVLVPFSTFPGSMGMQTSENPVGNPEP